MQRRLSPTKILFSPWQIPFPKRTTNFKQLCTCLCPANQIHACRCAQGRRSSDTDFRGPSRGPAERDRWKLFQAARRS